MEAFPLSCRPNHIHFKSEVELLIGLLSHSKKWQWSDINNKQQTEEKVPISKVNLVNDYRLFIRQE